MMFQNSFDRLLVSESINIYDYIYTSLKKGQIDCRLTIILTESFKD